MTKAICCGMGPCLKAPRSNSRTLLITNSTGGEAKNHFRRCEKCMDDDILTNVYERLGGDYAGRCGTQCEQRSRVLSSLIFRSHKWSWYFVSRKRAVRVLRNTCELVYVCRSMGIKSRRRIKASECESDDKLESCLVRKKRQTANVEMLLRNLSLTLRGINSQDTSGTKLITLVCIM